MIPSYWKRLVALVSSPCTRPIFFEEFSPQPFTAASASSRPSCGPVAAEIGVGLEVGRVVDQEHVDARLLRLLHDLGIGVEVGRHHDQHVGLRVGGDRLGHRLRAGLDAPVRVARLEGAAEGGDLALQDRGPALRQVEAHRHRHHQDALAGERLGVCPPAPGPSCRRRRAARQRSWPTPRRPPPEGFSSASSSCPFPLCHLFRSSLFRLAVRSSDVSLLRGLLIARD